MVGGDPADLALALPVLRAFGIPRVLGPLGAGQVAKACNQIIVGATIMALGECAVVADRAGLDLGELFEVLGGGYAGSRVLETRAQRMVDDDYSPSGATKYLAKDLALAVDEVDRTCTWAPHVRLLAKLLADMETRGYGGKDIAATKQYVAAQSHDPNRPGV